MPGGDGTGPRGLGPMTGRGAGFCAGFNVPGFMNPSAVRAARSVNRSGYGLLVLTAGLLSGLAYLAYCYLSQKTNK